MEPDLAELEDVELWRHRRHCCLNVPSGPDVHGRVKDFVNVRPAQRVLSSAPHLFWSVLKGERTSRERLSADLSNGLQRRHWVRNSSVGQHELRLLTDHLHAGWVWQAWGTSTPSVRHGHNLVRALSRPVKTPATCPVLCTKFLGVQKSEDLTCWEDQTVPVNYTPAPAGDIMRETR